MSLGVEEVACAGGYCLGANALTRKAVRRPLEQAALFPHGSCKGFGNTKAQAFCTASSTACYATSPPSQPVYMYAVHRSLRLLFFPIEKTQFAALGVVVVNPYPANQRHQFEPQTHDEK